MWVGGSQVRPLGQITRGKTAPNRLRQTDIFLAVAHPGLVRGASGLYVDLGYGAYPVTTCETFQRLRRLNPNLHVVGVEIDPQRVAEAEPYRQPGLEFRLGGFNLPLKSGERANFIRAFNVLRQYAESEVAAALQTLNAHLTESGLLIEGTCDPTGRLLTFNLFQKRNGQLDPLAFVLAPRLSSLTPTFEPRNFQAVLPKNFIHQAEPGGAIDQFFGAWHRAWQFARGRATDVRQIFSGAALRLADHDGYDLDRRQLLLKRAFLVLGPNWPLKVLT
jgi:hypothetical protein